MKIILAAFSTVILSVAPAVDAQTPKGEPMAVRASAGDVTDNRTTTDFNSECKVELKFTGDAAADAASVRGVRVKKAMDELGRDLVPEEDDSFDHFGGSQGGSTLKTQVKLRNPSRNAAVIKLIEGEVEFFRPTAENGGVVILKDILKNPAEPVTNQALQKLGVELMYLTKKSYEEKKKQMEEEQKAKPGAALGEAFGELFKGMFGGMMSAESANSVKLYVKDPNKRVVDLEFQDRDGKPLKRRGSFSSGSLRSYDFDTAPPADAQLRIHLATPEAIKTVPFKVEDIALP